MPAGRHVYGLVDPQTDELRYVGVTTDLARRHKQHCRLSECRGSTHRHNWLRSLIHNEAMPEMVVLEMDVSDWDEAERFWIAYFKSLGSALTNGTDGGTDMKHSAKSAKSNVRGRKMSPYHRVRKMLGQEVRDARQSGDKDRIERAERRVVRVDEAVRRMERRVGAVAARDTLDRELAKRRPYLVGSGEC